MKLEIMQARTVTVVGSVTATTNVAGRNPATYPSVLREIVGPYEQSPDMDGIRLAMAATRIYRQQATAAMYVGNKIALTLTARDWAVT